MEKGTAKSRSQRIMTENNDKFLFSFKNHISVPKNYLKHTLFNPILYITYLSMLESQSRNSYSSFFTRVLRHRINSQEIFCRLRYHPLLVHLFLDLLRPYLCFCFCLPYPSFGYYKYYKLSKVNLWSFKIFSFLLENSIFDIDIYVYMSNMLDFRFHFQILDFGFISNLFVVVFFRPNFIKQIKFIQKDSCKSNGNPGNQSRKEKLQKIPKSDFISIIWTKERIYLINLRVK